MALVFSIRQLLRDKGPSLTSNLKEAMLQAGLTDSAARQRLSRLEPGIQRLQWLKFPKREGFLYLSEQFNSPAFWEALLAALVATNSTYGHAIHGLLARGGMVSETNFSIVSGAAERVRKHVPPAAILDGLERLGFVERINVSEVGPCVRISANGAFGTPSLQEFWARQAVSDALVGALCEWLRRIGFVSWNTIKHRTNTDAPSFGLHAWDITGPSYKYPLVKKNKDSVSPGFVVADVFSGQVLSRSNIAYFLKKCSTIRSIQSHRPFLAMLIADRFDEDAFAEHNSSGVILTTPEAIFGNEVAQVLQSLLETFRDISKAVQKDPERLVRILDVLTKVEGAANNARGALFQLAVVELVRSNGSEVMIEIDVNEPDGRTDIDVLLKIGRKEVHLYECKGKLGSAIVSIDDVRKWFEVQIPLFNKWLDREITMRDSKRIFEFWTTGMFSQDAVDYLYSKRLNLRRFDIAWRSGKEVLEFAKEARHTAMVRLLKDHFLEHPIAKAAKVPAQNSKPANDHSGDASAKAMV